MPLNVFVRGSDRRDNLRVRSGGPCDGTSPVSSASPDGEVTFSRALPAQPASMGLPLKSQTWSALALIRVAPPSAPSFTWNRNVAILPESAGASPPPTLQTYTL